MQERLGIPALQPRDAPRRAIASDRASLARVRELLLPDERFGVRSPDDSAWFNPDAETEAGIAARDDLLRQLVTHLDPLLVCHLIR